MLKTLHVKDDISLTNEPISISVWGWATFFLLFNIYCLFWRHFSLGIEYNFLDSQIWFAKEWGTCVILTPIFIYGLNQFKLLSRPLLATAFSSTALLAFVLVTRLLLNTGEYTASPVATAVAIFPKYFFTFSAIFLIWYLTQKTVDENAPQQSQNSSKPSLQTTMTVEHRGLTMTLNNSEIIHLHSARNYVEICCESATYIKRTTLAKLIKELPADDFVQVHRSHVVNIKKATKLINTQNGGGTLYLTMDHSVPVSRTFKSKLKTLSFSS